MQDMDAVKLYEEQNFLGRVLIHPDFLDEIPNVEPEYFEDEANREIFKAIKSLQSKGNEVSTLSIHKETGKMFGDYIAKLSSLFPLKQSAVMFAKDIISNGKKIWYKEKVREIMDISKNSDINIEEEIQKIKKPDEKEDQDDFRNTLLKNLEWKMNNKGQMSGIATGIFEFDDTINGLNKGCLYVCAGRSSMGKSAFMTSIIAEIEKTKNVGIVSLEMTGEELAKRICSIRTKIPYWVIDKGKTTNEQFEKVCCETSKIRNLFIDDRGGKNCQQLCSTIKKMAKSGCDIVFVDHIGIVKIDNSSNLAHEVGKITSSLKTLSKELNIPIVALCQVNRGVEGEKDKRPKLSDLRDSGRIEEDADCVFFLYREEYYAPKYADAKKEKVNRYEMAEIIIQKNRNGACKNIRCSFDNQLMMFY